MSTRPSPRLHARLLWPAVLGAVLLVAASGVAVSQSLRARAADPLTSATGGPAAPSRTAVVPLDDVDPPKPAKAAEPDLDEITKLAGKVPAAGSGRYDYAAAGPTLGTGGAVRRFRVAVERGAGESADAFAEAVREALGDDRSWTAGGRVRLRQVGEKDDAHFTVQLTTRETARRICAGVGLDIRMRGVPYMSCRAGSRVVLNLDRWRLSVPDYADAGTSLRDYRRYLINHEVGHALGHGHRPCPGRGRPAPVMQQQTKGLKGCKPNPWPYP